MWLNVKYLVRELPLAIGQHNHVRPRSSSSIPVDVEQCVFSRVNSDLPKGVVSPTLSAFDANGRVIIRSADLIERVRVACGATVRHTQ